MDWHKELRYQERIQFLTEQGMDFVQHAVAWAPFMTEKYLWEHEDLVEEWLYEHRPVEDPIWY